MSVAFDEIEHWEFICITNRLVPQFIQFTRTAVVD